MSVTTHIAHNESTQKPSDVNGFCLDLDALSRSVESRRSHPVLATMNTARTEPVLRSFPDVEIEYEANNGIYWQYMRPRRRPSCTLEFLNGVQESHEQLHALEMASPGSVKFFVTASKMPGIFNLGGDLPHFADLIAKRDREGLRTYARACIDVQAARVNKMGLPYISISLVQGDALGGGFECVLADDVVVAEKGAKFGLPEVLFGLFPGMGAYSFLSRKLGEAMAERMIMSGRIYTAEELHDMGLVEILAEPGEGVGAVRDFVRRESRTFHARSALSRVRRRVNPVPERELRDVTDIWVETALQLSPGDQRRMQRLAQAQDRRWSAATGTAHDQAA